jgi:hypothetical protein
LTNTPCAYTEVPYGRYLCNSPRCEILPTLWKWTGLRDTVRTVWRAGSDVQVSQ